MGAGLVQRRQPTLLQKSVALSSRVLPSACARQTAPTLSCLQQVRMTPANLFEVPVLSAALCICISLWKCIQLPITSV